MLAAVLATATAQTASAAPSPTERLAAVCIGCHGPDGAGSGAMPELAGRDASALRSLLERWRDEDGRAAQDESHVMHRFARTLQGQQLDALAAFFADLESVGLEP